MIGLIKDIRYILRVARRNRRDEGCEAPTPYRTSEFAPQMFSTLRETGGSQFMVIPVTNGVALVVLKSDNYASHKTPSPEVVFCPDIQPATETMIARMAVGKLNN